MKKKIITIVDYGMGNIKSLANAFRFLGANVHFSNEFEKICKSEIVILPGVGSYYKAMKIIKMKGIDTALFEVIKRGNFLLSICLGMQLLGSSSNEKKKTKGLGLVSNKVLKFTNLETKNKKIPHVGFNKVNYKNNNKLFEGIENGSDFYFVHSYRMLPEKLKNNISTTNYGVNFLSYFNINNIYATQFHPEKSQLNGIKFLKNFLKIT
jgi:glutamine amidotransferase